MNILQIVWQALKAKTKHILVLSGVILISLFGYHLLKKHQTKVISVVTNPNLKAGEKEAIIIDPPKHQIEVITPSGSTKSYFPDQPSRISINNNGKVKITTPNWDFIPRPTVGVGIADKPKLFVGASFLSYKKLDLNVGFETDGKFLSETALDMSIGYNIHNSTYLFVGTNNHKDLLGGLRFRF
jgi:hypothetical protein